MTAFELSYTEPRGAVLVRRAVTGVGDVETVADDLLSRYQVADDMLPGVEISAAGGQSLSIAIVVWLGVGAHRRRVRPVLHANANADRGPSHDVRWSEPTPVPNDWFVPRTLA